MRYTPTPREPNAHHAHMAAWLDAQATLVDAGVYDPHAGHTGTEAR